ncbi:patatin-like phospholipase family protein [Stylonychia lemnae]|uniref:Patatin-like phospholipase family protein n=1 Tax=Stylonychia lemnae TaxID=5949 RepID=A0A077ZSE3_STYLE|nr:patatin-like phospholipase family protein [Stylonychia lemnae]|eukprot:CDW71376.1 patatin-like phospholipase family protein [Stylonychia lemnae]
MRQKSLSLLPIAFLCSLSINSVFCQQKCRALALSGGANKGVYEVGILYGFAHSDHAPDYYYDVVTGVSVGAINAGAVAAWKKEDLLPMSEWLKELWSNLTTDKVYQKWTTGYVDGLMNQRGLYDNSPLLNTLQNALSQFKQLGKKLVVAAVDVNTGQYVTFDEQIPMKDVPTAILASASIPFVFPPTVFQDHTLMDGGTVWNTNLVSAVDKCKSMGFKEEDVIIDTIMMDQPALSTEDKGKSLNSIENFFRKREITSYYYTISDIERFKNALPKVFLRHFITPSIPLASGLGKLSFDWKDTEFMFNAGLKDAQTYLGKEPGRAFMLMDQWKKDPSLQKEFPQFTSYIGKHLYSDHLY